MNGIWRTYNKTSHCAILCCLVLCDLGTGEGDVEDAEKLLQPYLKKYPKVLCTQ